LLMVFCMLNITHELTYYLGIRSKNPFEANALNYLWPLWLFLFTPDSGKPGRAGLNLRKMGLLLIAFAGAAIIALYGFKGGSEGYMPAVYGIASSASAAGYMLIFATMSRQYGITMPPLLLTTLPICSLLLWLINPGDMVAMPAVFTSWPILVYLSFFTVVVPEILWSYALRDFGGSQLSFSAIQIPFYSTLWLALVKWTLPSNQVLWGGSLILVSLWLSTRLQGSRHVSRDKISGGEEEDE